MSLRHELRTASPPWLQSGQAERFVYGLGLLLDILLEKLSQAMRMNMPLHADPSALVHIGKDKLIPQGLTEPDDDYRLALQGAYDAWQVAGNDWSLLRWVLHDLRALRPKARTVATRFDTTPTASFPPALVDTKWNTYEAGADPDTTQPTRVVADPGNWDWDTLNSCHGSWCWARVWLILYSVAPHAFCSPTAWTLGDPSAPDLGDDSWSIGFATPSSVFDALFASAFKWNGFHAQLVAIIISFDLSLFNPASPAGFGVNPDGNYGRWSMMLGATQVSARVIDDAYHCMRVP